MSYQFHGQRANENVLLLSKQHPFVLFHPIVVSTLILLLPLVAYIFMSAGPVLSVILMVCLLLAILHTALAWYSWKNTTFLLTTERIVFLEQKGVMHREFYECNLGSIQQVSHEVHGLWQTTFGFGTISVYTGGSQAPLFIRQIPDPYELQQEIQRAAAGEVYLEDAAEEEPAKE